MLIGHCYTLFYDVSVQILYPCFKLFFLIPIELCCRSSLYFPDTSPLADICIANLFSQIVLSITNVEISDSNCGFDFFFRNVSFCFVYFGGLLFDRSIIQEYLCLLEEILYHMTYPLLALKYFFVLKFTLISVESLQLFF